MSAPSIIRRNVPRFGSDRAGLAPQARFIGPMPWVIAIMVALTVMAAGGGLALRNVVVNARGEIAGGLTVQIVEGAPAERKRQAEVAMSLLTNRDDVAELRRVPEAELNALIAPWLGEDAGAEDDALPVPVLIDMRLKGAVTERRLVQLRRELLAAAPSARIDAQASWLTPVFDAINSLLLLAIGLIVLLALTSAAAVWLAVRSALGSNRDTIEIVHLLGGTDGQIARIFQRSIGADAAIGGTVGFLLGAAAIYVLGGQFAELDSGMVAGGGLRPIDWALLAAIPVVGVVLALFTTRLTVVAALRRML
jgi:cell division transport system permease protein